MKTILTTLIFVLVAYAAHASDGVQIRAFYVSKEGAIATLQGKDITGSSFSSGPGAYIAIQTKNHTGRPASGIIAIRITPDGEDIFVSIPSVAAEEKDWVSTIISAGNLVFPKGRQGPEIRWQKFEQE